MIDVIEARQNEGTNATGKRDSFYLKAQTSFRHDKALTIESEVTPKSWTGY